MRTAYINMTIPFSAHNAFIVENNTFVKVGRKAAILREPIDEIVDLKDKTVFPGFHDSHMHLMGLGWMQAMFNASKHSSISALIEAAKAHHANPLVGRGFHESQTSENRMLTRHDLDQITTDIPIVIYRVCGHMISVNSKAIEIAKSQNGNISYPEDSYNLEKGIFKEEAMQYVLSILPVPDADLIEAYILDAQKTLLSHGVTSVGSDDFHISAAPYERVYDVFKSIASNGKLKLNVLQQVNLPNLAVFEDFLEKGYANKQHGLYKNGPLKLLADGSLGARSAYLREPYSDDPSTRGIAIFDEEKLKQHIFKACEYDMDFAIHGIGDGIIEAIMNAKEAALENYSTPRRDSIIHAQLADHDQIKRMKSLNLGAQTQPIFIASDIPIIESRMGERANETYLFNSMIDLDIPTTVSTDAPIESTNPFENIYTAVTRKSFKHPEASPFIESEKMSLKRAIEAYTQTPSYFSYQSDSLGKIQKGYQADFIVVEGFDKSNIESLLSTSVLKTYKQGQLVFEKS